jgi:AraC-like DNA-binding protein
LNIGLSAGLPVTKNEGLFEETIKVADRLCDIANDGIVITSEVKDLYESENLNIPINTKFIRALKSSDEQFLMRLGDFMEKKWSDPTLHVDDFCTNLGYSQSQLYRKMSSVVSKSTNGFVKDFRLAKALKLMNKKDKNISEIAFESGFNSIAYFSKCFKNKYHILPSAYLKSLN